MTDLYHVRQYRPNYFTGFINDVVYNKTYDQITEAPWFDNFKHGHDGGFEKFVIEPYGGEEFIISAYYKNGVHWVVGFAVKADSKFASDWRYKCHES